MSENGQNANATGQPTSAELLQDAIGLISDEYVLEAHAEDAVGAGAAAAAAGGTGADAAAESAVGSAADSVAGAPAGARPAVEVIQSATGVQVAKRRRRVPVKPLAIAACLVLVLGVGLLVFGGNQPSPAPLADVKEDGGVMVTEVEGDAEVGMTAASDAEGAGAVAGDGYAAESVSLVPGMPPGGLDEPPQLGESHLLTGGEWNDNANWPFFTNLVNAGTISFPSFGIDPTHRVRALLVDETGNAVRGKDALLVDAAGNELWHAVSGKDGAAYLFYRAGESPAAVMVDDMLQPLSVCSDEAGQQGAGAMQVLEDVTLTVEPVEPAAELQVMFIVDTTGSMSDEIAYLQADFSSIAGEVGADGVQYSVNFYRDEGDEYVTKCNPFTSDVAEVQRLLNREYADGGGDTPEAVADILHQTITNNGFWRADCNKLAFLVFDAPPHEGYDDVLDAAVRSAASRGIRLVPVVASNADRGTELFGRALAICTNGTYVFLTDDSGVGNSHLEPIVGDYTVEQLHDIVVRIIQDAR